jgi:hypothetical protein
VTPKRVRLSRVRGARKPPDAVTVARPTRWGNPYRFADYRAAWPDATDTQLRAMAVSDFRNDLLGRFGDRLDYPPVPVIIAELRGRDLACWCPLDQPCHADVLLAIANG